MSMFFYVVWSGISKSLVMGRSTIEGILQKYLKGFTISEVNYDSQQTRGPNP